MNNNNGEPEKDRGVNERNGAASVGAKRQMKTGGDAWMYSTVSVLVKK
jgi:hypothetical protein